MARPPILSGYLCYHCGSDQTSKGGWSKGKRRYKCRACRRFFVDPEVRIGRPKKEVSTAPDSSPEVRKINPRSRKGKNRKELPSASHLILKLRAIAQGLGHAPTTSEITELGKKGQSYKLHDYYKVFGSFQEALRRARIRLRYRQEFDEGQKQVLLGELRALARRLKRPIIGKDVRKAASPTTPSAKRGHPSSGRRGAKRLVSPINHFQIAFGTVPNAIAEAGVAPKVIYSREEMIEIIRKLDAKLDRPVLASDIDELYRSGKGPAGHTVEKKFGGMAKARKAAGVKRKYRRAETSTPYWQKYTQEELIKQLKALGRRLGKKPTDRDINRASKEGLCASAVTFARMFGSLPNAYKAAGFTETGPNQRRWTDNEIISALKKLTKELGKFPGYNDIDAASQAGKCPGTNTITRRLGPLRELRSSAGFEPHRLAVRYTKEEMIAALKRLANELGRFPVYGEIKEASRAGTFPSVSTLRRLGTLAEVRAMAGFEPSMRSNKYTDEEIIAALKQLTKELGRFPTYREIHAESLAGKCPGVRTIYSRLGNLTEIRDRF